VQFHQYLNVLDELGYFPLSSKAEEILYHAAKKSIERLGESASRALLDHICSVNGLSDKELLTNYDLFEKSLYTVLRKGAGIILHDLKRELLVHAVLIDPNITISDIRNPRLAVGDILKRIRAFETLEFVRKIPSHMHVAFLYRNENSKADILSAFFDTKITGKATKGLLSSNKPTNDDLSYMLYEEILQEPPRDYEIVAKRLDDWIARLNSSNKSQEQQQNNTDIATLRVAIEDAMWWVRNGFTGFYMGFEKSMGRYLQDRVSVLCGYNISNVSNGSFDSKNIKTMIAAHDHVILDESFVMFRAANMGDKI
jgi:hypothetical protein